MIELMRSQNKRETHGHIQSSFRRSVLLHASVIVASLRHHNYVCLALQPLWFRQWHGTPLLSPVLSQNKWQIPHIKNQARGPWRSLSARLLIRTPKYPQILMINYRMPT